MSKQRIVHPDRDVRLIALSDQWYKIKNTQDVDSPALLIYPDRIKHNIDLAISMIDDVSRLRPHIKTHKNKEILKLQLDAGITKFKCATIAEAEMLGECGAPDVLLAYPLCGPKISKFLDLIIKFPGTRYSSIVDNEDATVMLADAATARGIILPTFIDLNMGMDRTGIQPGYDALSLYRRCWQLTGLHIRGFHAYDGHIRDVDMQKRIARCNRHFEPIARMIQQLKKDGFGEPQVIIGGSPSFPIYAQYPDVECSPGTFVFWDKGYDDRLPEQRFQPAAALLTRVVSKPKENLICVDLGYKAVASENPLDRRAYFLNAPELVPVSHSEEHLVLEVQGERKWQVGEVLFALPIHICPTVALYDRLVAVENHEAVGRWKVFAKR